MKLLPCFLTASEWLLSRQKNRQCLPCLVGGNLRNDSLCALQPILFAHHESTLTSHKNVRKQGKNGNENPDVGAMNSITARAGYIPRRAVMYIPGDDAKKIAKILTLKVDCPVLECEDGVALNRKVEARQLIYQTLDSADWVKGRKQRGLDVAVRINSIQSGFAEDDLRSILAASTLPTTLLVPKIEEKEQLRYIASVLSKSLAGRVRGQPLRLMLYIESAHALLKMRELLETALQLADNSDNLFALEGVVFGSDDFCADIGASRSKEATEVYFARQYFVTVVKSFQRSLHAIDLVHIEFKDLDDLRRQSEEGARFGFTGKQVIHPAQIDIVQQAYSPGTEKLKWAQELIAAFSEHQREGKGAFTFRNAMIDRPLLLQAQNIVEYSKLVEQFSR